MSTPIIQVSGLSKQYHIGLREKGYRTFRETITDVFTAPIRNFRQLRRLTRVEDESPEIIWALKDVSFEVQPGEVVGIIGRNGAGKSTLLKILSRITEPSLGEVLLRGRVASLLEVGTGFHPELTGRENIYLNGTILGMRKTEIDRKFDEIVAFSEIEKFLDTPVKHYSSGMYVRLAFAVAAHLEPEILLVDEVLAVGDMNFQKKCLGKMGDVSKQGRTVFFVSHNMMAIQKLCEKALWLDKGELVQSGNAEDVVAQYLKGGEDQLSGRAWAKTTAASNNTKAYLTSIKLLNASHHIAEILDIEEPLTVEVEYVALKADTVLNLSLSLFNQDDIHVFNTASINDPHWFMKKHPVGLYRGRCFIPGNLLNQGHYSISILLVEDGHRIIDQADRAISIDMVDSGSQRGNYFGHWGGVIRPSIAWITDMIEDNHSA